MADAQVWLVSSGEYSDFRIEAAFSNEEAAEKYAGLHSEYCVEDAQPLHDQCPDPVPVLHVHTLISRDAIEDPREEITNRVPGLDLDAAPIKVKGFRPRRPLHDRNDRITLTVEGTDHERVRKVYSERTAQALARFDELRDQPYWPN